VCHRPQKPVTQTAKRADLVAGALRRLNPDLISAEAGDLSD